MIVNPDFEYETKAGGYKVVFYNFTANSHFHIHGAIRIQERYVLMAWDSEGRADPVYSMTENKEWDLKKVKYLPKKDKAVVLVTKYPMPLPVRILEKFNGKRVKITLEEM